MREVTGFKKGLKQGYYQPPSFAKDKWIITETFDNKNIDRGIKYRSSYELAFMTFCSINTNIIKVNCEGIIVPYYSPIDNKMHKYYIDFIIKMKDGRIFLIEIKPYNQTIPPKEGKNRNSYEKAVKTYLINQAKWDAAKRLADIKGWEFKIITEKELFNK